MNEKVIIEAFNYIAHTFYLVSNNNFRLLRFQDKNSQHELCILNK